MKKYLLIVILLFNSVCSAQTVSFALSHTENGQPIDAKLTWQITNQTIPLYIILNNDSPISSPLIYLFIDKKDSDGSYFPFDSKVINIVENRTWVAYNYKFIEPGKYHIYFQTENQKKMADGNVTISKKRYSRFRFNSGETPVYDEYSLRFCELIIEGKPMNIRNSFKIKRHGRDVFIYMKSVHPLDTEKILVSIFTKKQFDFGYDEFFDSKKYKVDPTWEDTFFKYKFSKPGDYKIMIFNEDELLLVSGYVSITKGTK